MRRAAWLAVVAVLAGMFSLGPERALGHAALVRAEPTENGFLQRAPVEVALTFTETIDKQSSSIRVLTANAGVVATGPLEVSSSGLTARVTLPALKPGIYNVLWRNVSTVDGHALQGSYPFTVLNADGSLPAEVNQVAGVSTEIDPAPAGEDVAVRALSLLGLLLAAGAALVLVLLPGELAELRRVRLGLVVAGGVGALCLVAGSALQFSLIRDTFPDRGLGDLVTGTRTGSYWLVRMGAALGIAVGVSAIPDSRRTAAGSMVLGSLAFLWSYAATSHAAAGAGSGWAVAFDLVHGAAAVAWIGALVALLVVARTAGASGGYRELMPRFGVLASVMVFLVLCTGFLNSLVQLDTFDRLWTTRYGLTLTTKLGLMAGLLSVALFNARRGRRLLETGGDGDVRRFIRFAYAEAALGLLVFAAAAALTQTTVAKSVYERQESRPFEGTVTGESLVTSLAVTPNRTGLNSYVVKVGDSAGAPVEAERVRLTFRFRDDQSVGPSTLVLARTGSGAFAGQGPFLTLEGQWQVEVEVRRASADDVKAFFEVRPAGNAVGTIRAGGTWDNPSPGVSWNQLGGVMALMTGLGFALFKGRGFRWPRELSWTANAFTLAGFGVGALLLFGIHQHTTETLPRNPIVADRDSIERGRTIYQQNCVGCHGRTGVPPAGLDLNPYPLDLTVHVPQHPDGQVFNFIANGVQGSAMRAWGRGDGKLSDEEIWHVVNYLRTLGGVDR